MNTQTLDQDQTPFSSNVKKHKNWSRLIYMLIFGCLLNVAGAVMWALSALQFMFVLTTGEDHAQLRAFGQSLAKFMQQALLFVSYNTETKPFPFSEWPQADETVVVAESVAPQNETENKDDSAPQ